MRVGKLANGPEVGPNGKEVVMVRVDVVASADHRGIGAEDLRCGPDLVSLTGLRVVDDAVLPRVHRDGPERSGVPVRVAVLGADARKDGEAPGEDRTRLGEGSVVVVVVHGVRG